MSNPIDIGLVPSVNEDWDLSTTNSDLSLEIGLETAVIISIFTDARVTPDELPYGQTDLRGWWGDAVDPSGDQNGSKLWLLERAVTSSDTLARAQEYCQDALAWMVSDGIAQSVTVSATFSMKEMMIIQVSIKRPTGQLSNFEFEYAWNQQLGVVT